MLTLNNVSLRRGPDLLIEGASLTIHRSRKVGLIGANGTGKTSLFKLILTELEPDQGSLELPSGTRIAHLAQEVPGSDEAALDYVMAGDTAYSQVSEALLSAEAEGRYNDLAHLHEEMDTIDGYAARARAEKLLAGLGFSQEDFNKPLKAFSGGWRIRLNLARTLIQPSDLLLLDEPTNHLDLDAILYLIDWIRHYQGTLILISHDREFLDDCVDHIACLQHRRLELFTGNYSAFELVRAERLALQQSQYEKQQREISHMEDFVRRFRAKATKARQAQSRIKALERMTVIAPAHVDSPFSFEITSQQKVSTPLLVLSNAMLGYNSPVLSSINLTLLPGDRFGLLGVNGAGKTTLVRTLRQELPLLGGDITPGANLNTAYFSQHQLDELDLESSAIHHLATLSKQIDDKAREQELRSFLGGFDFQGDKVLEPVSTFSGGEKARLALALITYRKPNLLLMDEPTNHLDIEMRQALTVALQAFEGALVLVSHDRHLMNNTVDQFLLVGAGGVSPFNGDLADYRRQLMPGSGSERTSENRAPDNQPSENRPEAAPAIKKKTAHRPGRELRQMKTRIRTLDDRMERLQRKLSEVEEKLSDPALHMGGDQAELQGLLRDQVELKTQLSELEEEWLTLSENIED
jgi:ATP-binding cassette subfamily F protein 3